MIRFLYQMLDFFGSVFALLSPITIIHWLIEATEEKSLIGLVQWLDPFFHPLNSIFEPVFRPLFALLSGLLINPFLQLLDNLASIYGQYDLIPPELPYDLTIGSTGHIVPITQGLLGLCFTILFFLCSFGSQMLKATEQRIDVAKQDFLQRRRLQQLQAEQKKRENRATVNKNLLVYIHCDFQKNPNTANYFEQLYPRFAGQVRDMAADTMAFEFSLPEQAMQFCVDATQHIQKYYSTLRPIDPQPAFRIGIHSHDKNEAFQTTLRQCRVLSQYAGDNQLVLSQEVKNMLDATNQSQHFTLYPLGAYYIDGMGTQDLYRLVVR